MDQSALPSSCDSSLTSEKALALYRTLDPDDLITLTEIAYRRGFTHGAQAMLTAGSSGWHKEIPSWMSRILPRWRIAHPFTFSYPPCPCGQVHGLFTHRKGAPRA
jgi:hypothetical protein